ncbi:hypothetical protein B1C81_18280 [Streptomyces sp. HG99]|nr:hypothetical protein B1C81_18280 [Streptomyces sp. HG99]
MTQECHPPLTLSSGHGPWRHTRGGQGRTTGRQPQDDGNLRARLRRVTGLGPSAYRRRFGPPAGEPVRV